MVGIRILLLTFSNASVNFLPMFYTEIVLILCAPTLSDKEASERSNSADVDVTASVAFLLYINYVLIWMLMRYKTVFHV